MKMRTYFGKMVEDNSLLDGLDKKHFEEWYAKQKKKLPKLLRNEAIIKYKHFLTSKLATPYGVIAETDDLGNLDRGEFVKWARGELNKVPPGKPRPSEGDLVFAYKRKLAKDFIDRFSGVVKRLGGVS